MYNEIDLSATRGTRVTHGAKKIINSFSLSISALVDRPHLLRIYIYIIITSWTYIIIYRCYNVRATTYKRGCENGIWFKNESVCLNGYPLMLYRMRVLPLPSCNSRYTLYQPPEVPSLIYNVYTRGRKKTLVNGFHFHVTIILLYIHDL